MDKLKYIDLFCGIGGFRIGAEEALTVAGIESECAFSSDIDPFVQTMYEANFGEKPHGDITKVEAEIIPDHDLLFAGFPCQPFSIIGAGKGFDDTRGTLFFDIARILDKKRPTAFVLENVKRLATHKQGYTFKRIIETLRELGYDVKHNILNALNYGLPQKRERVFIVGINRPFDFKWPEKIDKYKPLDQILESDVDPKYYASEKILAKRTSIHKSKCNPSIWHENKSGNISSYPYSCALRAGASYNYLLVNGERRLTDREMLRLQGFPDSYKIAAPHYQVRKMAGNAVPVNLVRAVVGALVPHIKNNRTESALASEPHR